MPTIMIRGLDHERSPRRRANYPLRGVDPTLWARVQTRAKREGLTLRALILALLRGYADDEITVRGVDVDQSHT